MDRLRDFEKYNNLKLILTDNNKSNHLYLYIICDGVRYTIREYIREVNPFIRAFYQPTQKNTPSKIFDLDGDEFCT